MLGLFSFPKGLLAGVNGRGGRFFRQACFGGLLADRHEKPDRRSGATRPNVQFRGGPVTKGQPPPDIGQSDSQPGVPGLRLSGKTASGILNGDQQPGRGLLDLQVTRPAPLLLAMAWLAAVLT